MTSYFPNIFYRFDHRSVGQRWLRYFASGTCFSLYNTQNQVMSRKQTKRNIFQAKSWVVAATANITEDGFW
jgi:hypothetical protein